MNRAGKRNIKKKLEVVFDPEKRKEFLTGFRKRKNQRRKRAKQQIERCLKEERKRIRQEIKEGFTHLKKTFEPLRELTEEDKIIESNEYEDNDVQVKIIELTTSEMAARRNMLGENQGCDSEENTEEANSESESIIEANIIPGMDYDIVKKNNEERAETQSEETFKKKVKVSNQNTNLESKRDLDRLKKKKSLKQLKKSKVYKLKERLEKKMNQKMARKERNNTLKSLPKHLRTKRKFETALYRKGRLISQKQLKRKSVK
uniref:Nucleolar protein 12 n=1 Tax=Glossina brevipalpis TaxID=37001 RepID=A0A1A9W7N8_9MUSC